MKCIAFVLSVMIVLAGLVQAQQSPAQGQIPPAPAAGKGPPQAKSQEEFKAYQDAFQIKDPAAMEAAANSFAEKFKNSEIRYLLYYRAMFGYQAQNNADKAIEMGRKVLALNPTEPVTLALVAAMLSERTRETDLDRDDRLKEALQDAQKSLDNVDTDLLLPQGTPQERADENKKMVRSTAYGAMGNIYLTKNNYPEAEKYLKQAISLMPGNPDAVTVLRYAIALDQQKKYGDAMAAADQALALSPPGSPQADMARQERERLSKLTAMPAMAPTTAQPESAIPQK
jgi:tetratricopeptide (TPR) repeat protein